MVIPLLGLWYPISQENSQSNNISFLGHAPGIIKQPNEGKNIYTWRGQNIRIELQAGANPPPSYQWYYQRFNSEDRILKDGAKDNVLVVRIFDAINRVPIGESWNPIITISNGVYPWGIVVAQCNCSRTHIL